MHLYAVIRLSLPSLSSRVETTRIVFFFEQLVNWPIFCISLSTMSRRLLFVLFLTSISTSDRLCSLSENFTESLFTFQSGFFEFFPNCWCRLYYYICGKALIDIVAPIMPILIGSIIFILTEWNSLNKWYQNFWNPNLCCWNDFIGHKRSQMEFSCILGLSPPAFAILPSLIIVIWFFL